MAQNVGIPRFYVNALEWLDFTGVQKLSDITQGSNPKNANILRTLPVQPELPSQYENLNTEYMTDKNLFFAILGYTTKTAYATPTVGTLSSSGGITDENGLLINCGIDQYNRAKPIYNGWSLFEITEIPEFINVENENPQDPGKIGSMILGNYYDMSNAPNLSLTQSIEYETINEITAYNGGTYSNQMAQQQPSWGHYAAWELYSTIALGYYYPTYLPQYMGRSGRRVWSLSFSFMDNLWGSNQSLTKLDLASVYSTDTSNYESDDLINGSFKYDLLDDSNFFSQVWHKTAGGTLPFLFQPDNNNSNPDQFAIAKFRDNSLKANRTSPNTFDFSLIIEEVW